MDKQLRCVRSAFPDSLHGHVVIQGPDGAHRPGEDGASLGHIGLHNGLRIATAALQGLHVKCSGIERVWAYYANLMFY